MKSDRRKREILLLNISKQQDRLHECSEMPSGNQYDTDWARQYREDIRPEMSYITAYRNKTIPQVHCGPRLLLQFNGTARYYG